MKHILISFLLLILPIATSANEVWPNGIAGDIKFESSEFILKSANRNPAETALDLNQNGAYDKKNRAYDERKSGDWFIDYQRIGGDAIIAGIYKGNVEAISRGLKIIKWGFAQQKEDGSYTSGDAYHNVAFFLSSVSRAVLHLKNSNYSRQFESEIESLGRSIDKTASWLVKKDIEEPGLKKDAPYIHRYYINAAAIGFSGVLLARQDLVQHSQDLIKLGIAKQRSDGANPELNGTDTGYHCLGLLLAAQYYSIVADPQMRTALKAMGEKGAAWIASKVLENGDVDSNANTRTGANGEKRHGTEQKTVMYFTIYKSLAYWGQILGKRDFNLKAKQIFDFDREMKRKSRESAGK